MEEALVQGESYTREEIGLKYGQYPDKYIPYTDEDTLWYTYSVKSVAEYALRDGHLFKRQLDAHTKCILHPPLGLDVSMAEGDEDTAEMRNRTISQVVGFATSKLGFFPSMTVVANPIVVSAVCGFWQARGLSPWTIKLRIQHMSQAFKFVKSKYCPRQNDWEEEHLKLTEDWYKNLIAKALAEAKKHPKRDHNQHLWEAWDFATKDWVAFLMRFKVNISFGNNSTKRLKELNP